MQEEAQLSLASGDYSLAHNLIASSLGLANKNHWEYHEMESLKLNGDYYLKINKPDSAINCYYKIYHMAGKDGYVYWKADIFRSMLKIYRQQGDFVRQADINRLLVAALDEKKRL